MGILGNMFGVSRGIMGASCTGAAMTGNAIYTALQNARTKKEISRLYKNVADTNFVNRAVSIIPGLSKQQLLLTTSDQSENDVYDLQYQGNTPALDYIWGSGVQPEGIIVSGGNNIDRALSLAPFIHKAQQNGTPVVALHSGDRDLEKVILQHSVDCEFISLKGKYCNLFRGMTEDDIAYLLYETIPEDTAKPAAESLLRALIEVILYQKGSVSIDDLSNYQLIKLKDDIDSLYHDDILTKDEYNDICRYYLAGSSEIDAVRLFLNKLTRQVESSSGKSRGNDANIKRMLNAKGVVAIDVGKVSNELFIDLILNYFILLQTSGREFAIVIDGIQIAKFPKIIDMLRGRVYAISSQDFISSLRGGSISGDELFTEVMGDIKVSVLFRHTSGESRRKWSEYMGTYKKIRIRYNISQSNSFMNSSDSRGVSVDETDEPRIRPETLEKISGPTACIYCAEGILIGEVKE